jgi:uncharacterized protein (TIGR00304 family)
MSEQQLWSIGSTLVFVGFAIVIIAIILLFLKNAKSDKGKFKGGGVVIIGPIPIIFGTDKESVKIILVLSIILMILVLVWIVIYYSFR